MEVDIRLNNAAGHLLNARKEVEEALKEVKSEEVLLAITEVREGVSPEAMRLNTLAYGLLTEDLEKAIITLKAIKARLFAIEG